MSQFEANFHWQGRTDSEDGEAGMRWHQKVSHQGDHQGIALLGYACDLGVAANKGRTGAKHGPDAIRAALANLAWHLPGNVFDAGTVVADTSLAQTQAAYAEHLARLLQQHDCVFGLGGGHDIGWGSYQGLKQYLTLKNKKTIGIINFDAHFDLRRPSPHISSGTPFYQVAEDCKANGLPFHYACLGVAKTSNTRALFERANDWEVAYLHDRECTLSTTQELLIPFLNQIDELYVTICLDAFAAHLAPGVSAPSALGIEPGYVIDVLHWLAACQEGFGYQWRLTDIAEMNPDFDIDKRTAKLAARLLAEVADAQLGNIHR